MGCRGGSGRFCNRAFGKNGGRETTANESLSENSLRIHHRARKKDAPCKRDLAVDLLVCHELSAYWSERWSDGKIFLHQMQKDELSL